MLIINAEDLSMINAAIANVARAYSDKEVPDGALDKYITPNLKTLIVTNYNGMRVLSVRHGDLYIDIGAPIAPAQPTSPTSGTGEVERERKVA